MKIKKEKMYSIPSEAEVWEELNRLSSARIRRNRKERMAEHKKLEAEFPDFNTVVTIENIFSLCESDPDLADSILANPNTYSQSVAFYRAIKRFGIYQEPNHQ
jgi:hypothetical protein